MKPGTILFKNFQQITKGRQDRELLVILSDGEQVPHITVKTTSQSAENLGDQFGCQIKEQRPSFFLPLHSTYLKEDTWILLDHFGEFNPAELVRKRDQGKLDKVCSLPKKVLNKLLVCAISCKDLTEDQKKELWRTLVNLDSYFSENH